MTDPDAELTPPSPPTPPGSPQPIKPVPAPALDRSYRALLGVPSIVRILAGMTLARIAGSMVSVTAILFTLTAYHSPALPASSRLPAPHPA
jgi:hypothetical protein